MDSRSAAPPERRPQDFASAAATLDRPSYENLRRALALGRWPDGRRLDERQRRICLEAVIAWEAAHLPPEARTGHVERGACADGPADADAPRPLRILGDA